MKIKIEVLDAPSRSKGWARYAAKANGEKIVSTTTGNEWVGGTTKEGDVEAGTVFEVRSQVCLNVGKGFRAKQEITTEVYRLEAVEGAVTEVYYRPGSQGQRLRITGARQIEEGK